jgi:glycosyltransferase involved in cell wall biosynthesis
MRLSPRCESIKMSNSEIKKILEQNYRIYLELTKIARLHYEKNHYARALQWLKVAATFTYQHHAGIFADGRIENIALEIGKKLDALPRSGDDDLFDSIPASSASAQKKVLHLASGVYNVGGHSRLIKNWIQAFPQFNHSLLVTEQNLEIPDFLSETLEENGGDIFNLPPAANLTAKARAVRRIARGFDYVLLHHHPNDIIPVVALATEDCPPVAAINHADHLFGFGIAVTDLMVEFCRLGEQLSKNRRFARETTVVPYLISVRQPEISRREARQALGTGEDAVVLITIGSPYKYQPNEKYNFFATAKKILERNPAARLYLIGAEEAQASAEQKHERMIFTGFIPDPILYQAAADIYVEGFPVGGGLATVESVLFGACPVFAYDQLLDSSSRRLLEFEALAEMQNTEAEYIDKLSELIENAAARRELTEKFRERIVYLHGEDKFNDYARATFGFLDKTRHQPLAIPSASPKIENEDVSLCVSLNNRADEFPLLLQIGWDVNLGFTLKDFFALFKVSFSLGDTKFSGKHWRAWFGTFKEKLLSKGK